MHGLGYQRLAIQAHLNNILLDLLVGLGNHVPPLPLATPITGGNVGNNRVGTIALQQQLDGGIQAVSGMGSRHQPSSVK